MDITEFMPTDFHLRAGKGGGDPRNGLCFMEVVSLIAGEKITDHPECACPILTSYGVGLNDRFDDQARQRLLPLAWATAGSRSKEHEAVRMEIIGRAAIDCAKIVLPIFEARRPGDMRARQAIEAAIACWDHPSDDTKAAAAAAYAAAAAAAAADTTLKKTIEDRAVRALREAIEAGPNGGLPDKIIRERIDAVREFLPTA